LITVAVQYFYARLSNTDIINISHKKLYDTTNVASAFSSYDFRSKVINDDLVSPGVSKRDLKLLVSK